MHSQIIYFILGWISTFVLAQGIIFGVKRFIKYRENRNPQQHNNGNLNNNDLFVQHANLQAHLLNSHQKKLRKNKNPGHPLTNIFKDTPRVDKPVTTSKHPS